MFVMRFWIHVSNTHSHSFKSSNAFSCNLKAVRSTSQMILVLPSSKAFYRAGWSGKFRTGNGVCDEISPFG
jgi:hypothetical protein